MRITQESDYALRIVTLLAARDAVSDAKSIADETSVTPRFALKILHKLVQSSLVRSYKGMNGGYRLAKRPEEITVKDMIELIDGPITICRCLMEDEVCSQSADKRQCLFHHIFSEVSHSVSQKLARITIADVISSEIGADELLRRIRE